MHFLTLKINNVPVVITVGNAFSANRDVEAAPKAYGGGGGDRLGPFVDVLPARVHLTQSCNNSILRI